MTVNKIDNFNEKAEKIFLPFLKKYGYLLEQKKTNIIDGQNWSVHHIYKNDTTGLKIIIKQEPYYTDYGFSIFIYKLGTGKYSILYNVPSEKQDKEDKFLDKVCEKLFSDPTIIGIINGKMWREI